MIIDIVFAVLMVLAIFKGMSRGIIVALFSFLAIIIGLAAALKLSASVASVIGNTARISFKWLPFISFILVMVAVAFIVRILAGLVKKSFQLLLLGWIDSIGGIIFYMLIYTLVYSVTLFFADKVHLINIAQTDASKVYSFIKPVGPKVIDSIGTIIPFFKDIFHDLEIFFESVGKAIPNTV